MVNQDLQGVPRTLLIPLWARATESKRSDAIIRDELSVEMVKQIDFDFSQFNKEWATQVSVAVRTEILDKAAKTFIDKHPKAVIINLGCGLDTRFFRMDNGSIRWYDLDLPGPIGIRKHFFSDTDRYKMIEKSVFDYSWENDIVRDGEPVLIIAEGLLMYFMEQEIKGLMNNLVTTFPKAEMLFEMVTPAMVRYSEEHVRERFNISTKFQWGITSGKESLKLSDKIKFIEEWNYMDYHKPRWNLLRVITLITGYKNKYCNRIVHLLFS